MPANHFELKTFWQGAKKNAPLFLFFIFAALYLAFPSQQYDLDTLPELKLVVQRNWTSPDPAHMLYARMGILATQALPFAQRDVLLALNALFGAGAVGLFAKILGILTGRPSLGIVFASLAGFSYAFWLHVADAFFITPATFFALLGLWLCLQGKGFLAGFAFGFAILAYQANVFLVVALVAACLNRTSPHPDTNRKAQALKLLVATGVICALGWGAQGVLYAGVQSPSQFAQWLAQAHGGMMRGLWRRDGVILWKTVPVTWLGAFVPIYEGLRLRDLLAGVINSDRIISQLALLFFLGLLCVFIAGLVLKGRQLWRRYRLEMMIGLCWMIPPTLAAAWFDPAETKLIIIPALGLIMVMACGIAALSEQRAFWPIAFSTMAVFLIGASTFSLGVWPYYKNVNPGIAKARAAQQHMTERDILLSAGFDWSAYLDLFANRRTLNLVYVAQQLPAERAREIVTVLDQEIRETYDKGGHIYIMDYFGINTDEFWRSFITPNTALTPQDLQIYDRRPAWFATEQEMIWEICAQRCNPS